MRSRIELENEIAAELAGSEDAVLRALEGHLECAVFLRGNVLTLEGDDDAVQAAGAATSAGGLRDATGRCAGAAATGVDAAPSGAAAAQASAADPVYPTARAAD